MENTTTDLETAQAKLAEVELTQGEATALAEWLAEDEVSGFSASQPQGLFSLLGTTFAKAPGRPEIHDIEMERVRDGASSVLERTPYD